MIRPVSSQGDLSFMFQVYWDGKRSNGKFCSSPGYTLIIYSKTVGNEYFLLGFKCGGNNTIHLYMLGDNYDACYLVRELILKTWIESDAAKMARNKKHFIECKCIKEHVWYPHACWNLKRKKNTNGKLKNFAFWHTHHRVGLKNTSAFQFCFTQALTLFLWYLK